MSSTVFYRGQQLGRDDLNIFLVNLANAPVNAAEISYALYDFTTGQEVLIGSAQRAPQNPSVGEYFASLVIPLDANVGAYRIRWMFRESIGGPLQQVVQEFAVIDKPGSAQPGLITGGAINPSVAEIDLMNRLRILLRDNCVGGEELVELDADGTRVVVRIDELWEALQGPEPSTERASKKVREAFTAGKLKTLTVAYTGHVQWQRVLDVSRADVGPEEIVEVETQAGVAVLTAGHRVFTTAREKVEAGQLRIGQETVSGAVIQGIRSLPSRQYMFDLTTDSWHNFILMRSMLLVSNSPDRNYMFRPPAHEETISQFNRVFGYIWEDVELQEYLARGVDMISASPPRTPFIGVDQLMQSRPEWRTLLLTGAMMFALQALRINWVATEFNYSVGGISLDLEKSSKYEGAYQAAADLFDKQLEKAKLTVNVVRGLQQPRFGMGVRSSFGPAVGRGVLSPRKYVGFQ